MFLFMKKEGAETDADRTGKMRLILIIGGALLGVLLLLFGSGAFRGQSEEEPEEQSAVFSEEELREYQAYLEKRIKTLCESVNGVGSATVVVMLEGGFEDIYATEEHDGDEQYVIIGSGANATALHLSRAMPQICGIGVVCTGGSNPNVQRELTSLLGATFHLSVNRIYVTGARA